MNFQNSLFLGSTIFLTQFLCQAICTQRTPKGPSNRRLNEHGIYIRHCQESNSQPVPSQAGADPTRPQFSTFHVVSWLNFDLDVFPRDIQGSRIFFKPAKSQNIYFIFIGQNDPPAISKFIHHCYFIAHLQLLKSQNHLCFFLLNFSIVSKFLTI